MNRKMYFLFSILGFGSFVSIFLMKPMSVAQSAWFFWSASMLFLPVWGFFALAEYFLFYESKNVGEDSRSARSFVGSPLKFIVMTTFTVLITGFFHIIIGLFLSIVLPVEPFQLFSINGYNNHFDLELILYHLKKFSVLIPTFLILKSLLLFLEPGVRLRGHGSLRDGMLPLLGGFLTQFIFKNDRPVVAAVLFAGILFLPWTLVFGKDRFDKASTQEPEFEIPIRLPVEYVYRPNVSSFWGYLLLLSAVFILAFSLYMGGQVLKFEPISILIAGLGVVAGCAVAAMFCFAGANMLFSFRKVFLSSDHVEVLEKAYVVFIPKIKSWKCSLLDYWRVEACEKIFPASSDENSNYFVVELIHKSDSKRNVQLYKAYHDDHYKKVADRWKKILNLKE